MCGKVGGQSVITGMVLVNDEHIPLVRLKNITGFVPQDDIVHHDLSVRWVMGVGVGLCICRDSAELWVGGCSCRASLMPAHMDRDLPGW